MKLIFLILILNLALAKPALSKPAAAENLKCEKLEYQNAKYDLCSMKNKDLSLRMAWKKTDGLPYGSFSPLRKEIQAQGRTLLFATNAGPYQADLSPVGLYIENSKELVGIKKPNDQGEGNLFIRPNGVFYFSSGHIGILKTEDYLAKKITPEGASQSGPMLLMDGVVNARLDNPGTSLKTRDAVCLKSENVIFSITETQVSFRTFALFLKSIGCQNALLLDTTIASFYSPELKRNDVWIPIGPMIALLAPARK